MFLCRNQKPIESFTKTHPGFLRNHIDVQKPMRIVLRGFIVHLFELLPGHSICKSTVYLIQLCFITGLENQVLWSIQTDGSWYTYPTLNQETDGEWDMSMFDAQMIQHPPSSLGVHTTSLTIITN